MSQEKEATLEWVLVNNERHHVSDFKNLKRSERPDAICPVCRQPVVLKLGNIKVHHAAHKPDSTCAITNPETAEHFNAKMALAAKLEAQRHFSFSLKCDQCRETKMPWVWLDHFDEVKVEYTVSSVRPDVSVLLEGKVIGAFEIVVSHRVDSVKRAKLEALKVDWVEIDTAGYVTQWNLHPPYQTCNGCIRWNEEQKERYAKEEAEKEFKRHNYERTFRYKLLNLRMPNGDQAYGCFLLNEVVANDVRQRLDLLFNRHLITTLAGDQLDDFAKQFIQTETERHIQSLVQRGCQIRYARPWQDYKGYLTQNYEEIINLDWFDVTAWVAERERIKAETAEEIAAQERYREYLKNETDLYHGSDSAGVICISCHQRAWDWFGIYGKPETYKCRKCTLGI